MTDAAATTDPAAMFRAFNEQLIAHVRANRGVVTEGPFTGRPILLLTTHGGRTGVSRVSPLVYSRDGDRYVIVASKGGAPTHPHWYLNLLKSPRVTVETGGETFTARATVAEPEARRRALFDAHATEHPGFKDYELKTERRIPVVVLEREA